MSQIDNVWDYKDPEETITGTFDFSRDIGTANITGTPATSIAVQHGDDPAVASVINGSPQVAGSFVLQSYKVGVRDVDYYVRCKAALDDGRVLVLAATMPVRQAH